MLGTFTNITSPLLLPSNRITCGGPAYAAKLVVCCATERVMVTGQRHVSCRSLDCHWVKRPFWTILGRKRIDHLLQGIFNSNKIDRPYKTTFG